MNSPCKISAVILAAGKSSRLKQQKAFLLFENEKTFLQKIAETYISADEIIVVINSAIEEKTKEVLSEFIQDGQARLVLNQYPGKGRFYSIKQGLQYAGGDFCFLQNIDNPFISTDLLVQMLNAVTEDGYVVPDYNGKDGHPVLLSKNIVKYLLSLKGDFYNMREELNNFAKTALPWQNENILANINTEEEYQNFFSYAKHLSQISGG